MTDDLVVYLDTQAGGFSDTSMFNDDADGGRTAVPGFNGGNPSQTIVTFPAGFQADFALSIENGFLGVFQLAAGGDNSHTFLFGQARSGNNMDTSYGITMPAAQMDQIGLTANSGQTFSFVGTLISTSAYRSNETIGPRVTTPGDGADNAGFSNPQTCSSALSFTLKPDLSTFSLVGLGLLGALALRRRKA